MYCMKYYFIYGTYYEFIHTSRSHADNILIFFYGILIKYIGPY